MIVQEGAVEPGKSSKENSKNALHSKSNYLFDVSSHCCRSRPKCESIKPHRLHQGESSDAKGI